MRVFYAIASSVMLGSIFLFGSARAQPPKEINGGVLNGKAVSLPKPAYPDAAKATGAQGSIAVDIIIDENGDVISAEADPNYQGVKYSADGTKLDPEPADESLRAASVEAALKAKFSPTFLSGQPVKVKGRLVYNFVATGGNTDKAISGGVLSGNATSMPAPAYPAAAKAVRAEGAVTVQVTVDESGNVVEAAAISGHPLLRSAAVEAARKARFNPTMADGNPVKVTGIVTYVFKLPARVDQ